MQNISGQENELTRLLISMAEPDYRKFSASLLPGTRNILGVRLPQLRRLAKQLARKDWKKAYESCGDWYFEEIMLQGFLIGYSHAYAGMRLEEIFSYTEAFLPKIDNWSVCDSFCATLKIAEDYPEQVFAFLQKHLDSQEPFTLRFVAVMLLDHYIRQEYISRIFPVLDSIRHSDYYVKMAVAWAISMCYVKFPEETQQYLSSCSLDDFTYNKALSKITESHSVGAKTKERIRGMKRKG